MFPGDNQLHWLSAGQRRRLLRFSIPHLAALYYTPLDSLSKNYVNFHAAQNLCEWLCKSKINKACKARPQQQQQRNEPHAILISSRVKNVQQRRVIYAFIRVKAIFRGKQRRRSLKAIALSARTRVSFVINCYCVSRREGGSRSARRRNVRDIFLAPC